DDAGRTRRVIAGGLPGQRLVSGMKASIRGKFLVVLSLLGFAVAGCRSEIDIGQPVEVIIVPTQSPTTAAETTVTGIMAGGTVLESLTANPDFALFVAGWERIGRSAVL